MGRAFAHLERTNYLQAQSIPNLSTTDEILILDKIYGNRLKSEDVISKIYEKCQQYDLSIECVTDTGDTYL